MKFRDFNSNPTLGTHDAHIRLIDRFKHAFRVSTAKSAHLFDERQLI
jgi:hypothetical protein